MKEESHLNESELKWPGSARGFPFVSPLGMLCFDESEHKIHANVLCLCVWDTRG